MSNKYISQINNQNFVYPNYSLAEYDVDIIHTINDYSVSGLTTQLTGSSITSTGMTFNYYFSWSRNSAQVVNQPDNILKYLSVHMMAAGQTYYKPWRMVSNRTVTDTGQTTIAGTATFQVTPSQLGLTSFITGTYYFEFRFIGLKSIYPVCQTLSITVS